MSSRRLSTDQIVMLRCSGHDPKKGCGFGVRLMSARNWRTARALERRALGGIEHNHPPRFFANQSGTAITRALVPVDGRL